MRCLGVLWGYGGRDELETAGADALVASPADLARTIFSMAGGHRVWHGAGPSPDAGLTRRFRMRNR